METTNIYILKLENNKYYIGKSDNVEFRYQQHLAGIGSAWTKKYKPLSLEKTISNCSHFDEDKFTKEYMHKYGIENVRGGSYVEIELDEFQVETLKREIWGAKDLCKRCGRSGHFIADCYAKSDASGNEINTEYSDDSDSSEESYEIVWQCNHCKREFDTEFGCMVHERNCKNKSKHNFKQNSNKNTCFRCGRYGHYAPDCYAETHIKGYELD